MTTPAAAQPQRLAVPGRIVEIYADGKVGNDWPAVRDRLLDEIVRAQAAGEVAAYVDAYALSAGSDCEGDLDLMQATAHGVDNARMLVSMPQDMAQALDVVSALVRSGQVQLVVLAGLPRVTPEADKLLREVSKWCQLTKAALVIGRLQQ